MTKQEFWEVVDTLSADGARDPAIQEARLEQALREMDAERIADFDGIFRSHMIRAFTWDLWGAAYLLLGGCSDDGFMDFRATLIAQGQNIFEAALANPDSLLDFHHKHPDFEWNYEGLLYVPAVVYEAKAPESQLNGPGVSAGEPAGMRWEEDEGLPGLRPRMPRLHAHFIDSSG